MTDGLGDIWAGDAAGLLINARRVGCLVFTNCFN